MTDEQLKKGRILSSIIEDTREGLEGIKELNERISNNDPDNEFDDGLYTLSIRECSDGRGAGHDFKRYTGNVRLLRVMLVEIGQQLAEYEHEFAQL